MTDGEIRPKVVVFDFETTGLSAKNGDRIIEIGAVKLDGNRIVGVFETLVNPGFPISSFVEGITGINDDMLKTAPVFENIISDFLSFAEDDMLVAHNVNFDRSFLLNEMDMCGLSKQFDYYCTLTNSRKKLRGVINYKLATLKEFYKFKTIGEMHRALSDSFVTAQLYLLLNNLYGSYLKNDLFNALENLLNKRSPNEFYKIGAHSVECNY